MNKTNIWFYEKISWFDKPLARPTKKKKKMQITKIKEETLLSTLQEKKGPQGNAIR